MGPHAWRGDGSHAAWGCRHGSSPDLYASPACSIAKLKGIHSQLRQQNSDLQGAISQLRTSLADGQSGLKAIREDVDAAYSQLQAQARSQRPS